jgi:hypothetical protein
MYSLLEDESSSLPTSSFERRKADQLWVIAGAQHLQNHYQHVGDFGVDDETGG